MRIGTVGTGFVVSNFIEAACDAEGIEIAAVYSRTAEQADSFANKHSVGPRFYDRDAFLTSDVFDVVYVAAPNSLHYQWVKDALYAGKNVICEKPFVSTATELEELIELAGRKKLFLFEAITTPHLPNYQLLSEHINEIGDIKIIQMNFSQYSSRYEQFLEGRKPNVFNPEFSGGALMDINYYNLYFTVGLFGRPNHINYFANIREGIDTSGILLLEYDGFKAVLTGCKDSKSKNMAQIQGDKGFIIVRGESSRCASFVIYTNGEEKEFDIQQNPSALYYELVEFGKIYRNKDFTAGNRLLKKSLLVTELVQCAREKAGITFPADVPGKIKVDA